MKTIPLTAGLADFSFSTQLDETRLKFNIRWLTRYNYFTVDIRDSDDNPVACGRALHAGVNLLAGLNVSIGKIMLEGDRPTTDNLGIDNNLNWYPDD